jgi:hypothetical protein
MLNKLGGCSMTKQEYNFLLKDVEIFNAREIDEEDLTEYNHAKTYSENGIKYVWMDNELSHNEIVEALLAKNLQHTRAIKQMLTLWTIVLVVGLVFVIFSIL